jgi:carboxymethylenebutenolidase
MAGRQIKITAADGGAFDAYLSSSAEQHVPGLIMLHEIFGVTEWIKETADFFAEHGFCVAAPDMFWRLEPNFVADHRDSKQADQGRRYKQLIDHDKAVEDIAAAIADLKSRPECNGKVGVTGFCTGGTLTYLAAARLEIDAAAAYYGTQIHEFLDEGKNITCPTIFHMGETDDRVPAGLPDKARSALDGVSDTMVHTYDAGHAFAHTGRPDYYSEMAAKKAHARTFELFDKLR